MGLLESGGQTESFNDYDPVLFTLGVLYLTELGVRQTLVLAHHAVIESFLNSWNFTQSRGLADKQRIMSSIPQFPNGRVA